MEECLILCDSRIEHNSGELHKKQREAYSAENKTTQLKGMVALCREMHRHLIRGELVDFGRCLDKGWQLKRSLSSAISNSEIDTIYQAALSAGAVGGKLLGAGAGGFLLFFVQPQYRQCVTKKLLELNCKLSTFKFETGGVTSWRTKIL